MLLKLASVATILLAACGPGRAQMPSSAFIGTIGVDTHMAYTDGRYRDVDRVIAHLAYIGVRNVRDGISNGARGSAGIGTYVKMARTGVAWTFLVSAGGPETDESLNATLALIRTVEQGVPGSVRIIEGTNEINNYPVLWNGSTDKTGRPELEEALAMQRALYSRVRADPVLGHVKVAMFTGAKAGSIPAAPDPGSTPGLADLVTQHPYPNHGGPPAEWLARGVATPGMTGPAIYTETGYSSNGGTSGGVDADVQARYGLDLLFDAAKLGIVQTSWYQLLDAYPKGSRQGDDGYGLFDFDGAPKPIAVALHNLTTIMAEAGGRPSGGRPAAIGYTVEGLPKSGQSMMVSRSDGAADILVWAEPAIWNSSSGSAVAAAAAKVTVTLDQVASQARIFDPLAGVEPVQQVRNTRTVTVDVTDHPVILRVERARP